MHEVERLLLEARMTNARLLEDNESYQLLLSQKTLGGEFHHSEFMGTAQNTAALNALEGRPMGASLADELAETEEEDGEGDSKSRRLENDLKASKAENKALTLYINKIIERLLQHQDFEAILDQSSEFKPGANVHKDLPPPPEQASGASILQRAKSVAMGATRRPRPQSYMPSSNQHAVNDLDKAPSIPFGVSRSSSVRTGRPKSEQYTGGAANVVNQMYKGNGQISPPIHGPQTPRQSQSFFAPPAVGGNPNAASRIPSVGSQSVAGNFPGMRSETSSTSGDSGEVNTPGNSPPRKEEKATQFSGNKPRPLRLVQDNPETTRRASMMEGMDAKRASWMGWAFGKKEEVALAESIKE